MDNNTITVHGVRILKNEPLSKYTFTKTGGDADYLAFPQNIKQFQILVDYADQRRLPITTLGNASNLIIRSGGVKGLVIMTTNMRTIKVNGHLITADSGAAIIDAAVIARKHRLSGLEFAAGIPGSIGGAVFMNAGAYGGNTGQVIQSVTILDSNNNLKQLKPEQLDFGYRHSIVQKRKWIVLKAVFNLKPGNVHVIQSRMDNFNAQRSAKQPLNYPSCGSVFKRPKGHYAGQLIHDSGLQGYRSGGAQVSRVHAGFIVNVNHATANDYLNVIHHVQSRVYKDSGVHLHTEVRIIGDR